MVGGHAHLSVMECGMRRMRVQVVEFLPGNCAPTKDVKALARAVKANRK